MGNIPDDHKCTEIANKSSYELTCVVFLSFLVFLWYFRRSSGGLRPFLSGRYNTDVVWSRDNQLKFEPHEEPQRPFFGTPYDTTVAMEYAMLKPIIKQFPTVKSNY